MEKQKYSLKVEHVSLEIHFANKTQLCFYSEAIECALSN